jgi:phosphoglycolate phosphatase-like HAD superfamily hydrolase
MMKLLALDFDGVISDSAVECFWVALRTYVELQPETPLIDAFQRLGSDGTCCRGQIENDPLYRRFLTLMPLGNRSEDFAVILALLEQGTRIDSQADYDRELTGQSEEFLTAFHRRFYEIRYALVERDRDHWLGLMGPYPPFTDLLRARAGEVAFAVATAKDRRSVLLLLDSYGLGALFPPERVLDKETGVSKRSHIESLQRRTRVPASEITFVDDKVSHLDRVAPLGARCALATWGYNSAREHVLAEERGYLLCTLENAAALLFD